VASLSGNSRTTDRDPLRRPEAKTDDDLIPEKAERRAVVAGRSRSGSVWLRALASCALLWSRIAAALDLGVRQQITRAGLLFTAACLLVALAAFASANNLLFLILAAMLSTFMISGLVSKLSLAGLQLDFMLPEHIAARRKLSGRIAVRNMKSWMPSFSIHLTAHGNSGLRTPLYFPVIPGGATIDEPVELYFDKRGSYRENSFRFATRHPFGFTERRASVLLRREIIVYPSIDAQPGFEQLLVSLAGDINSWFRGHGRDFYRIRPYEAMESARHVDWKATAHVGELQVREFAHEQEQAVALFLDIDVADSEAAWFERAVDCCAYLAWTLSRRAASLRFITQDVELRCPDETDVYGILKYLALVFPRQGKTLGVPHDQDVFQVVFSASPDRLANAGWNLEEPNVRLLGPDDPAMADS
jgi:hypothetical protein